MSFQIHIICSRSDLPEAYCWHCRGLEGTEQEEFALRMMKEINPGLKDGARE